MDDLLTSYISQMLTTMSKQRSSRGHSRWTSYWREAAELVHVLRGVGQPCSWNRTFAWQLWRMSRSPSNSSQGSVYPDDTVSSPSSEDDYLWLDPHWVKSAHLPLLKYLIWPTVTHCDAPTALRNHFSFLHACKFTNAGYKWPAMARRLYIAVYCYYHAIH